MRVNIPLRGMLYILLPAAQHKLAYQQVIRDRGHMHDDIAAHTNRQVVCQCSCMSRGQERRATQSVKMFAS